MPAGGHAMSRDLYEALPGRAPCRVSAVRDSRHYDTVYPRYSGRCLGDGRPRGINLQRYWGLVVHTTAKPLAFSRVVARVRFRIPRGVRPSGLLLR